MRAAPLVAAALVLAGCGGDDPPASPSQPPPARVVESGGELAVGITEPNPNFFRDGEVPPAFSRWRTDLIAFKPAIYRLGIDWAAAEPVRGEYRFDETRNGCMRTIQPCAPWNGLRDQLKALAQRQDDGGWQALVVPYGTPPWAAEPAGGCERAGTEPRNRAPTAEGAVAYGQFVKAVTKLASEVGAELRYWSPWNEPNHPYFISPQRSACERNAPAVSVGAYARLARAVRSALASDQEMVLGELAGLTDQKTRYTNVFEFAKALPRDVACAADIWGQHLYVGGEDPLDDVTEALKAHRCKRTHELWITETGAQGGSAKSCRSIRRHLVRWYEDPRVTAAIQYTLREDDGYPVGLVSTDLESGYPALEEWKAWGTAKRPDPADPPPEPACAG